MDYINQLFTVSFGAESPKRKNDIFLATLLIFILLVAPVIGIASIIHDSSQESSTSPRFNDATCQSQAVMASTPAATNRMITSHKDVIKASINLTIENMTDTDREIDRQMVNRHNLGEEEKPRPSEGGWPEWLSPGDRKLLQSASVKYDVVVAADGSEKYRTVAEAVETPKSSNRFVIWIKAGVYKENVVVPSTKTNIMFIGDGATITTIIGNRSFRGGSDIMVSPTVGVIVRPVYCLLPIPARL